MFNAVGSTCAAVTPKGPLAISAGEGVASELVGKIGVLTVVSEAVLTALRARSPCTFPNQLPPRNGMGPLPLKPSTFCRNFPRGLPTWLVNQSLAFNQSLR